VWTRVVGVPVLVVGWFCVLYWRFSLVYPVIFARIGVVLVLVGLPWLLVEVFKWVGVGRLGLVY
jgi:hypothetical protein